VYRLTTLIVDLALGLRVDGIAPMQQPSAWRQAVSRGLHAGKVNLKPGIVIWILAGGVLLSWSFWPAMRSALEALAEIKSTWNYFFAFISTALAGAVVPGLVMRAMKRSGPKWITRLCWLTVFWAAKGIEVNFLYEAQAHVFGSEVDAWTLVLKTCFDQFVYCPIWAVPTMAIGYTLINSGWAGLRQDWAAGHWYARCVLPILLANWGVWVPTVLLVYALPTPLQLPVQNLVLCLWSLIVSVLATRVQPIEA
jgi:uncharacterized protein YjeT (DUF2065 family)